MKKTVLTFGLISGGVASLMMLATLPFMDRIGFDRGAVLGYTSIVLSFLLVYFGIRSYRDTVAGGQVTFGRAFSVGLLITLVSCVCYVATWELIYFKLQPDFADKFGAYLIESKRSSGASAEELAAATREVQQFRALYDQPLYNIAFTFLEPFPIGLVVTLISAGLLRTKRAGAAVMSAMSSTSR